MSLRYSKCLYSNNCIHFLKCAVPLVSLSQIRKRATLYSFNLQESFQNLLEIVRFWAKWEKSGKLKNFFQCVIHC
jgi:hypothetical protein